MKLESERICKYYDMKAMQLAVEIYDWKEKARPTRPLREDILMMGA